jgi:hypothetical protein
MLNRKINKALMWNIIIFIVWNSETGISLRVFVLPALDHPLQGLARIGQSHKCPTGECCPMSIEAMVEMKKDGSSKRLQHQ